MVDKYKLIFKGDIVDNEDIVQVKKKISKIYRLNMKETEKLFSGKEFNIKRNSDLQSCKKMKNIFKEAGAICEIEQEQELNFESMKNEDKGEEIKTHKQIEDEKVDIESTSKRLEIQVIEQTNAKVMKLTNEKEECPNCGTEQSQSENRCQHCGYNFSKAEERIISDGQSRTRSIIIISLIFYLYSAYIAWFYHWMAFAKWLTISSRIFYCQYVMDFIIYSISATAILSKCNWGYRLYLYGIPILYSVFGFYILVTRGWSLFNFQNLIIGCILYFIFLFALTRNSIKSYFPKESDLRDIVLITSIITVLLVNDTRIITVGWVLPLFP